MKINDQTLKIEEKGTFMTRKFIFISIIGILLSLVGYYNDPRFFHSYLVFRRQKYKKNIKDLLV